MICPIRFTYTHAWGWSINLWRHWNLIKLKCHSIGVKVNMDCAAHGLEPARRIKFPTENETGLICVCVCVCVRLHKMGRGLCVVQGNLHRGCCMDDWFSFISYLYTTLYDVFVCINTTGKDFRLPSPIWLRVIKQKQRPTLIKIWHSDCPG